jgi:hypothetical protein
MKKLLLLTLITFAFITQSNGQITVTTGLTAAQIAAAICGPGVTIANIVETRNAKTPAVQAGTYTAAAAYEISIKNGILLTTGSAARVEPGGNKGGSESDRVYAGACVGSKASTDADLSLLNGGGNLYDIYSLEFDIQSIAFDTLVINYQYGSDEYLEFVGSSFTDAFGFFLKGNEYPSYTNFAWVPGTPNTPITVNTINPGTNSAFYVDNPPASSAGVTNCEYDGYTIPIQAKIKVTKGQTYRVKIAIADCTDGCLDTGIFIQASTISNSIVVLPIELLSFETINKENKVNVNWSTATETNTNYFDLERSVDGVNYKSIFKVNGAGNSNSINTYSFIDENPASGFINYYRLREVDFNGHNKLSKVNPVNLMNQIKTVSFWPNPIKNKFTAEISFPEKGNGTIEITDISGRVIISEIRALEQGSNVIDINTDELIAGTYFFRVKSDNYVGEVRRISK